MDDVDFGEHGLNLDCDDDQDDRLDTNPAGSDGKVGDERSMTIQEKNRRA